MRWICVVPFVVALGCGNVPARPGVTVRDSAGIRIVENAAPDSALPRWRLVERAEVEIGTVEGAAEAQFNRVSSVVHLRDGRFVVANAGVELRVYDAAGGYVRTIGGRGGGPGEFARIAGVLAHGDTIYAYDASRRRVTLFDTAGTVVGEAMPLQEAAVGPAMGGMRLDGIAADGRYVFLPDAFAPTLKPQPTLYRVEHPNLVVGADRVDTVGVVGVDFYANQRRVMVPPFMRWSAAAAGPTQVFVTHGERYEVEVWGTNGLLERLVRLTQEPATLPRSAFDSAVDASLDDVPEERRAEVLDFRRSMPAYATRPAYGGGMHARRGGGFVVQEWADRSDPRPRRWHVFDAEGRLEATMETPGRFTILSLDEERAVGVWRDELDVEFIRAYRIARPAR